MTSLGAGGPSDGFLLGWSLSAIVLALWVSTAGCRCGRARRRAWSGA